MSLHFRLEDLNTSQRNQVLRQLNSAQVIRKKEAKGGENGKSEFRKINALEEKSIGGFCQYKTGEIKSPPLVQLEKGKMSKTEIEFNKYVLGGKGKFEAITLKLAGGSRYTPDFLYIDDGVPVLVEVKGSYRLQSEGRAHTAFLEAAAQFSSIFKFVWVVKQKGGEWDMKYVISNVGKEGNKNNH